jgi:hypothetical protein
MKFNSVAVSTLFVKISFKKKPYSDEVVCLRIIAGDTEKLSANTAPIIYDFDTIQVEPSIVKAHIERIRKQNNYAIVQVL